MARKTDSSSGDSVTFSGAKLDALRAVLCCTEFKGTFIPAGKILGLTQPKQANTLFRGAIAMMGLDLKDGKVFMVGSNDNDDAAAASPVKASANKRKRAPAGGAKGASKKFKTEVKTEVNATEDESATTDDAGSKKGGKVDAIEAAKVIKVEAAGDAA